jgi:hypothetical protein
MVVDKGAVIDIFMTLLAAEEAYYVDNLPCKAAALEARAMLNLFELLKDNLNLNERQHQVLAELNQHI